MLQIRSRSKTSSRKVKSIGVLTSGGDAPGMNAAIRSVVRYGISAGLDVYGIYRGYSGLIEGDFKKMDLSSVGNIIQRGGTILKTSRCEKFHKKPVRKKGAELLRRNGIDGLVVIGGDGSFRGAQLLGSENRFPVVGIPGTIDNDIAETDDTIGFDTAVNTALEAIDRIRDTASSHDRVFITEVMGRDSGFIAVQVGIASGAETIIVPEQKKSLASIEKTIDRGHKRGKLSSIIVAAEGPNKNAASQLMKKLESRGRNPRLCILGHTQRGGRPTAHDRFLATALGAAAVDSLLANKSGLMLGTREEKIVQVPFSKVVKKKKKLTKEVLKLAEALAN